MSPIASPPSSDNAATPIEQPKVCSSCELILASDDQPCPRCGKEQMEGAKESAKARRKPRKYAKVECPYCGEMTTKRFKKCPACRTSLRGAFKEISVQTVDRDSDEIRVELAPQLAGFEENEVSQPEPIVPANSTPDEEPVKTVGDQISFQDTIAVSPVSPEEPFTTVHDVAKADELIPQIDQASTNESPEMVNLAGVENTDPGNVCLAIVPLKSEVNALCIVSPIETLLQAEPTQETKGPQRADHGSEPSVRILKRKESPIKPARKRRLKSAKSPTGPTLTPMNDIGGIGGVISVSGQTSERR